MEKRWTVYCHTHTESGRRYIGITVKTMMHRWNQHCAQAKSTRGGRWHFPNAIRKYGKDAFSHEILEICHGLEVANLAEECWIEFYGTRNPEAGFNLAKGGLHVPHPIRKNPWDDPGFRERNLAGAVARINTPEARAAAKRSMDSPDVKVRKSAATKALWDDPEYREKRIISITEKWHDTVYREKREAVSREVFSRPEVVEKMTVISRRANSDPEYLRRKSEATKASWQNPGIRAKRSAASKASNARPEVKARISEGVRAARERRAQKGMIP